MSLRGAIATKQSKNIDCRATINDIAARNDGRDKRMKKAFTLVELLVAISIMALMMVFAGTVFRASIDMYRVSTATAEIMQKLRAVTDQLDADFKGLRKDAPVLIWFQQPNNGADVNDSHRFDEIMFFAVGDFGSIQTYAGKPEIPNPNGNIVIRGDAARIFYGQATTSGVERNRILARRQHILTDDPNVDQWPQYSNNLSDFASIYTDSAGKSRAKEEGYEYDALSLSQWEALSGQIGTSVIPVSLAPNNRPQVNTSDPNTFHKLFCQGVGGFAIQWAYWDGTPPNSKARFYWYPSNDPYGTGADSQFTLQGATQFGVYFNILGNISTSGWYTVGSGNVNYRAGQAFPANFFPAAFKFTFTLYDSKGVIKDGMTFSHIVYLEQ